MLNYHNTGVTVELGDLVASGVKIWDFDYPSYYKGEEKVAFEQKVIDHYFFRQIGQETPGRWLHYFRTRIREIMPYYIRRYKSVELMDSIDDPFESYNLTETYERQHSDTGIVTGSSSGSSESSATRKHSDTPMGTITNLVDHISSGDIDTGTGSSSEQTESNSEGSGSESYTLTRKGNIGVSTLGEEVNKLRASFINVDMEIINELNDLFLQVY